MPAKLFDYQSEVNLTGYHSETKCLNEEMPSECYLPAKIPKIEMDPESVGVGNSPHSPIADRVSSAADAMLKLSAVPMFIVNNSAPVTCVSPVSSIGEPQVVNMANNFPPMVSTETTNIPQLCMDNTAMSDKGASSDEMVGNTGLPRLSRKQREFIPEPKKDEHYWMKRRKNNEAAKRSREKRRMNDIIMGQRIMELTNERNIVQQELDSIKKHFGLPLDKVFPMNSVTSQHPVTTSDTPVGLNTPGVTPVTQSAIIPQIIPASVANHLTQMQRTHQAVTAALSSTFKSSSPVSGTPHQPPQQHHQQQQQQQHIFPQPGLPQIVPHLVNDRSVSTSGLVTSLSNAPVYTSQPQQHLSLVDSTTLPLEQRQALATAQMFKNQTLHHHQQETVAPPIHIAPTTPSSELNDTAAFHSQIKVPDICEPISPASSISSTPDLTISLSAGSSSENSDGESSMLKHLREAPLNLSKRPSATVNEYTYTGSSSVTTDWGVPPKLRYKATKYEHEVEQEQNNSATDCSSRSSCCSIQEFHVGSSVGNDLMDSRPGEHRVMDSRYVERRRKNNFAARKCRENRRLLCNMKIMKSAMLESENQQLRNEMKSLADEVKNLKDMVKKKKVPTATLR